MEWTSTEVRALGSKRDDQNMISFLVISINRQTYVATLDLHASSLPFPNADPMPTVDVF